MKYSRPQEALLKTRLSDSVHFINLLAGPRQVGKTTIIRDIVFAEPTQGYYVSVDDEPNLSLYEMAGAVAAISPPQRKDKAWLAFHWQEARNRAAAWLKTAQSDEAFVFAIDEIQKIEDWSNIVKGLWDADRANGVPMHVVLLGSAPLLMQKGLSESLAGRYETLPVSHWGFAEMQEAFGLTLEQYVYFGGYPGSAWLIKDETRWRRYVRDSLIQPNIEKDILQMVRIKNPMLLKQLFELGCHYSGQELSLTKMIEAIIEAKHTETLADYLHLLTETKLLAGLHKYAGQEVRKRNSAPKLHVFNTALMSALQDYSFAEAQADRSYWGRLVESSVGAHLLNTIDEDTKLYYWREGNQEVDFVLAKGKKLTAIEVKSAPKPVVSAGLNVFGEKYPHAKKILVGAGGVTLAEFLSQPAEDWLE
ncbi:ATP-binding protein [Methylomonas koyamae]|uniref:ATP-binding protein n=1 Tax=Methylomonas koyamae TaxID=702114 RepID=UPI00112BF7FF|nr:ATP-binding protein [Methylomonas koyamae]TPQ25651.1 AAA family ATPase [Methylomonas koyamae]